MDLETPLVSAYRVGKRTAETTWDFIYLKARLRSRVQISSDAFPAYARAISAAFGRDVDYAHVDPIAVEVAHSCVAERRARLRHADHQTQVGILTGLNLAHEAEEA